MNNINLTMELCQEDRNRLDKLIAIALDLTEKHQEVVPAETQQGELEGQVSIEEVLPKASGKLGDGGNEKLLSAVQQKVVKLSAAGNEKKAAVREIVQKYATKVSDIPAEEYDNVMEHLAALEG